jgi:hypothetical protein
MQLCPGLLRQCFNFNCTTLLLMQRRCRHELCSCLHLLFQCSLYLAISKNKKLGQKSSRPHPDAQIRALPDYSSWHSPFLVDRTTWSSSLLRHISMGLSKSSKIGRIERTYNPRPQAAVLGGSACCRNQLHLSRLGLVCPQCSRL